ncbi:MAG: hypothetical protein NW224_11940 [Leptolyngbyaceae cyanobacterium bins.302]|nr:hypothetical protein [Leptolyngbyaceae cyanobacterium bins.302]
MTNTPNIPHRPESGTRPRINAPFYPVTWEQAVKDYHDGIITPRGLVYCYFVVNFRPGTETQVDVDELCKLLQLHEATYYRAVGALKAKGRLNIRRGQMRVSIPEIGSLSAQSQSCEFDSQLCENDSQICELNSQLCETESQSCENGNELKPSTDGVSRNCANVPNRSFKYLKEQQTVPPTHPVTEEGINSEGIGTNESDPLTQEVEDLCTQIEAGGVRCNKTIQEAIATLLLNQPAPRAAAIVRNALSSLQEQQELGMVRNPGGFLKAALQRGFTANGAKAEARHHREEPTRPQPPSLTEISLQVDSYLMSDRRDWALNKLEKLWSEGWHDQLEELLQLRRDWGFSLTQGGVSDGQS